MNKEAKAIVDYLEEEREAIRTKHYYPDDVLNCEDLIMVMDYIKQLETKYIQLERNVEEALKKINSVALTQYELLNLEKDGMAMIKEEDVTKLVEAVQILEGVSNE